MLNYVWAALVFLGICAALSSDIIDISSDSYRNGQAITGTITLSAGPVTPGKRTPAVLLLSRETASAFYGQAINSDVHLPAEVFLSATGKASLILKVENDAPEILKRIARASGKDDDISATAFFLGTPVAGQPCQAQVTMESVSFLKINSVTAAVLEYAEKAVTIAIGLIGVMALWLGIMKIAESAGVISMLSRLLTPVMKKLFPEVPENHPAIGAMIMNISANFLGLGNAATPFGLKAMEELDSLNPERGTATNAMCMFLTINTAGMTLIPATAIALRASAGSLEPASIIGTSLFGSSCATIAGILTVKLFERFSRKSNQENKTTTASRGSTGGKRLLRPVLIGLSLVFVLVLAKLLFGAIHLSGEFIRNCFQVVSIAAIPFLIIFFILLGFIKKVKVYEQFIEGAKEGFSIAIKIIPYLVAMLCAIGIFRAGGAMDWLVYGLKYITDPIGMPAEALPMALMRPLSGSGSLGVMAEIMAVHGPDSFIGKLVSTFYGSSETTFYVLAVYFGSVQIKKTRYALPAGLIADAAGMLGALFIVKLLFG